MEGPNGKGGGRGIGSQVRNIGSNIAKKFKSKETGGGLELHANPGSSRGSHVLLRVDEDALSAPLHTPTRRKSSKSEKEKKTHRSLPERPTLISSDLTESAVSPRSPKSKNIITPLNLPPRNDDRGLGKPVIVSGKGSPTNADFPKKGTMTLEKLMENIGAKYEGLSGVQKDLWGRLLEDAPNISCTEISEGVNKLQMSENVRNRLVELLVACYNAPAACQLLAMNEPSQRAKGLGKILAHLKIVEQMDLGLNPKQQWSLNELIQETADVLIRDDHPGKQKDLLKLLLHCDRPDRARVLAGLMLSQINRSDAVANLLVNLKGTGQKDSPNHIDFQEVYELAVESVMHSQDPVTELKCLAQISARLDGKYSPKIEVGNIHIKKKYNPDAAVRRACDKLWSQRRLSSDQVQSVLDILPTKGGSSPMGFRSERRPTTQPYANTFLQDENLAIPSNLDTTGDDEPIIPEHYDDGSTKQKTPPQSPVISSPRNPMQFAELGGVSLGPLRPGPLTEQLSQLNEAQLLELCRKFLRPDEIQAALINALTTRLDNPFLDESRKQQYVGNVQGAVGELLQQKI